MRYAILNDDRIIDNIIEIEDADIAAQFNAHYIGENRLGIGDQYPSVDLHPDTEMELLGQSITDEQLERIQLGQQVTDIQLQLLAINHEDGESKEA